MLRVAFPKNQASAYFAQLGKGPTVSQSISGHHESTVWLPKLCLHKGQFLNAPHLQAPLLGRPHGQMHSWAAHGQHRLWSKRDVGLKAFLTSLLTLRKSLNLWASEAIRNKNKTKLNGCRVTKSSSICKGEKDSLITAQHTEGDHEHWCFSSCPPIAFPLVPADGWLCSSRRLPLLPAYWIPAPSSVKASFQQMFLLFAVPLMFPYKIFSICMQTFWNFSNLKKHHYHHHLPRPYIHIQVLNHLAAPIYVKFLRKVVYMNSFSSFSHSLLLIIPLKKHKKQKTFH